MLPCAGYIKNIHRSYVDRVLSYIDYVRNMCGSYGPICGYVLHLSIMCGLCRLCTDHVLAMVDQMWTKCASFEYSVRSDHVRIMCLTSSDYYGP